MEIWCLIGGLLQIYGGCYLSFIYKDALFLVVCFYLLVIVVVVVVGGLGWGWVGLEHLGEILGEMGMEN